MRVFISWSGPISQQIAAILAEEIPCILQNVKPFISSEDIKKGTCWQGELAKALEESSISIICATSESLGSDWVHFEAGALSKLGDSRVCTVLFGVEESAITGPLV